MTPPSTLRIGQLLEEREWLARLCDRLVRDAADADDVAQEAMMRALNTPSAASAQGHGRLRGWLTLTVRNVMKERGRSAGQRRQRERSAARPDVLEVTPESALAGAQLRERLARHVIELPRDEREAVTLRFYEGLRPSEIATRLDGVSEGAVRQRIHRGVQRLREKLEKEDSEGAATWLPAAIVLARNARVPEAVASVTLGGAGALPWVLAIGAAVIMLAALTGRRHPVLLHDSTPLASLTDEPPRLVLPALSTAVTDREELRVALEVPAERTARRFRVLNPATKQPMAGADWYLQATGPLDPEPHGAIDGGYYPPSTPLAEGTTDASGFIELPLLTADLGHLIVSRSSRNAAGSFAIDGTLATERTIDLVPPVGATWLGRFVDVEGQPIPGAEIMEYDLLERTHAVGRADDEGRFRISRIASVPRQMLRREDGAVVHAWSERSRFFARASEYDPWCSIEGASDNEETAADLGKLVIKRSWKLPGRVVDPSGSPVANAIVGLIRSDEVILNRALFESRIPYKPWQPDGTSRMARTDAEGSFALPVGLSELYTRITLEAQAPDGSCGTLELNDVVHGAADRDPAQLTVSSSMVASIHLVDRMGPGEPIVRSGAGPHLATWCRSGRKHSAYSRPLRLFETDILSLPTKRFSRLLKRYEVLIEVPGYDPATLMVGRDTTDATVLLDRRVWKEVQLRFTGEHALPGMKANAVLVSEPPSSWDANHGQEKFPRGTTKTVTSGGGLQRVSEGQTLHLAWPFARPAWLVVEPCPIGPFTDSAPVVIGPVMAPTDGTVFDIEVLPWRLGIYSSPPDLELAHPLPVY